MIKRNIIVRDTGVVCTENVISYVDFEKEIFKVFGGFIYQGNLLMDKQMLLTLRDKLMVLAETLDLKNHPIRNPKSGKYIWGIANVAIGVGTNDIDVIFLEKRP